MAETMSQATMVSLIEQAIDTMPDMRRMQKRAWKQLLNRPRLSADICDQLAAGLCEEDFVEPSMKEAINADGYEHTQTMLAFNPDNLTAILDWILKNLPAIIALFFR